MSIVGGYGLNGKSIYTNICKPIDCSLQFTLASGASSALKSNGYVKAVTMSGSGYCKIQFNNNFNKFIGMAFVAQSPLTGSELTSGLTVGVPYVITTLGASTLAQWNTAGVPAGLTPSIGMSYVAAATSIVGGGKVKLAGSSGVLSCEVVGDPNQSISNSNITTNGGAYLMLKFLDAAGALAAPADGSVISITARFDGSSVSIDGL